MLYMSNQKAEKTFDAVQFQRKQRDDLSKKYSETPEKFFSDLKIVEQSQPLTKGRTTEDKAKPDRRNA